MTGFNLSGIPKYETLSYTWDSQIPSRPITCNGSKILITPNVEAALKQMRRQFLSRRLWIDSICIDQDNLRERGQQVSLMGSIYQQATRVVVWLGAGDQATARAIWMLKWVFPVYKMALQVPFVRYTALALFQDVRYHFQDTLDYDDGCPGQNRDQIEEKSQNRSIEGMRHLVHHSWFRRIWTLQEISLARRAIVQCGDSKIGWTAFSNALTFENAFLKPHVPRCIIIEGGYNPAIPLSRVPFLSRMQQIQSLHEWMRRARARKSWPAKHLYSEHSPPLRFVINLLLNGRNPDYRTSDPRDRVLGLIGLLRAFGLDLMIPDYTMTLSEIILETFTSIATKTGSLEFLHFVTSNNSSNSLPSWIPEFSRAPWCPSDDSLQHSDNVHMGKPGVDFKVEGQKLWLSGILLDTIDTVTTAMATDEIQQLGGAQRSTVTATQDFLAQLQTWIKFIRTTVAPQAIPQDHSTLLLFKLLLHSQIMPFYNGSGLLRPPSFISSRLLEHFRLWLLAVDSNAKILTDGETQLFDQTLHFISSEFININSEGAEVYGYARALLVIHRWARENTAQKRLFITARGYVGIGWQALKKGDRIISVPGLQSPLILRSEERTGVGETYRLVGPCLIPTIQGENLREEPRGPRRFFEID